MLRKWKTENGELTKTAIEEKEQELWERCTEVVAIAVNSRLTGEKVLDGASEHYYEERAG